MHNRRTPTESAAAPERMDAQAGSGQRPTVDESALDPLTAERQAKLAKALDTLWLAHQPIVSTSTGQIFGYEVLMRFEDRSLAGPPALLELAEQCGYLPTVGRAVRHLSAQSPALEDDNTLLFVNLHSSDLCDETLFSPTALLTLVASRVVLEVTERASLDTIPDVRAAVKRLRDLGFRIAVDDLGSGYSGLTSLALLEPEFVKIDMSLIRDLDSSPTKRSIVSSLITLARNLSATVVSEGVETEAERRVLVELGSDLLQGYLLGRPGIMPKTATGSIGIGG